jgi:hypothetical protein
VPQDFQLQRNRIAEPQRIGRVVVEFIVAQRVNKDVESLPVEHQPGDDFCKRGCPEDDLPLRGGMRAGDAVVGPKFNRKPRGKVLAQLVGNGRAPGVSVVNMDVIAGSLSLSLVSDRSP